ncbi:hypothetical protein J4727_20490, partial [Providencia rettgeri]|nr:hypothetical protein [Providencia rettgeri]
KDKQANCGSKTYRKTKLALPPNHAAVSKDYSAYLIRAPINGLGISWIAKCRKKPNLTKLSQINELRDHDPITDHGESNKMKMSLRSVLISTTLGH